LPRLFTSLAALTDSFPSRPESFVLNAAVGLICRLPCFSCLRPRECFCELPRSNITVGSMMNPQLSSNFASSACTADESSRPTGPAIFRLALHALFSALPSKVGRLKSAELNRFCVSCLDGIAVQFPHRPFGLSIRLRVPPVPDASGLARHASSGCPAFSARLPRRRRSCELPRPFSPLAVPAMEFRVSPNLACLKRCRFA